MEKNKAEAIFLFVTHMRISTLLILRIRRTHVIHKPCQRYGPARHEPFVAQWLEHPTGVRKVIGSTHDVGDSDFFFVPCS